MILKLFSEKVRRVSLEFFLVSALIGGTGLDIRSYKEVCKLLGDFLFNAWRYVSWVACLCS